MNGFLKKIIQIGKENPDFPAMRFCNSDRSISYKQLNEEMERWCGFIRDQRILPGERVLVVLPPSPEFIASVLGLFGAGVIVIPVNHLLTSYELEQFAAVSQAVAVITTREIAMSRQTSLPGFSRLRLVVSTDMKIEVDNPPNDLHFAVYDPKSARRQELNEPHPDQNITCHYTYKGLGYPLGVLHDYKSYSRLIEDVSACVSIRHEMVHFLGLPIYPVYGLALCVFTPLYYSGTLLFAAKENRNNLIETIAEYKIDFACVVPEVLALVARGLKTKGMEWNRLLKHRPFLTSGGSYLAQPLSAAISKYLPVHLMQGYGTTETLPCIFDTSGGSKAGTIGLPVGATQVKILNALGQEIGPNRIGEICISGPYSCAYFDARPRETTRFFHERWFRTGDLGYKDNEGYVFFEGQRQSFSKVMSQMVDLIEVENVALQHPGVARAKALVEIDDNLQSSVRLDLVGKRRGNLQESEIQRFMRAYLSPHKVPRKISIYRSNRSTVTRPAA